MAASLFGTLLRPFFHQTASPNNLACGVKEPSSIGFKVIYFSFKRRNRGPQSVAPIASFHHSLSFFQSLLICSLATEVFLYWNSEDPLVPWFILILAWLCPILRCLVFAQSTSVHHQELYFQV